jgi:hypothetical protein
MVGKNTKVGKKKDKRTENNWRSKFQSGRKGGRGREAGDEKGARSMLAGVVKERIYDDAAGWGKMGNGAR